MTARKVTYAIPQRDTMTCRRHFRSDVLPLSFLSQHFSRFLKPDFYLVTPKVTRKLIIISHNRHVQGFKPESLITEYLKFMNSLRNLIKMLMKVGTFICDEWILSHLPWYNVCGQRIVLQNQCISVSKFKRCSSFKILPQCVVFCGYFVS
jgi:hypothetical protein